MTATSTQPVTEYRGFRIEPAAVVQLGYRIGEGTRSRPGRGRKVTAFLIYGPDGPDGPIKTKESLSAAKAYIDDYIGPQGDQP